MARKLSPEEKAERQRIAEAKKRAAEEKRKEKERKEQEELTKQSLEEWLLKTYHVFLVKSFYTKLEQVFSGKLKGLPAPIPPEHLLDMWQQQINYLNRVALRNKQRGKEVTGIQRLNYDLAILLSMYGEYLRWRMEREAAAANKESANTPMSPVEYQKLNVKTITDDDSTVDIGNVLDEI